MHGICLSDAVCVSAMTESIFTAGPPIAEVELERDWQAPELLRYSLRVAIDGRAEVIEAESLRLRHLEPW